MAGGRLDERLDEWSLRSVASDRMAQERENGVYSPLHKFVKVEHF